MTDSTGLQKSEESRRYALLPQMREYDGLRQYFLPYLNQANPANHRSSVVNTDPLGFRESVYQERSVTSGSWFNEGKKGLLLGGSVAFGWGAPSDDQTLASHLALATNQAFLTLGIMAANSTIETIAGIPFYSAADQVISITGTNTFYCCVNSPITSFDLYAPLYPFNNMIFEKARKYDILFLSHLLCDDVSPTNYFKNPQQKKTFRSTVFQRWSRRMKTKFFGASAPKSPRRSIEESVELAIKIQSRDALHIARLAGENKFLCVLQPFLPALSKSLSPEEAELESLHKAILKPEVYQSFYDVFRQYYSPFIKGVKEFCDARGIHCIDLHHVDYSGWIFADTSHLTGFGNKDVANRIRIALGSR